MKQALILGDRFARHVMPEPMSGCWLWTAYVQRQGYGMFRVGRTKKYSHRVAYSLVHGVGRELAERYGVSEYNISDIKRGKTWAHVTQS